MPHQDIIKLDTPGRGTYNISQQVDAIIQSSNIHTGLAHVFVQHTSASLIICENADPTVREDLERFMYRLTPDGDSIYQHVDEGADDMPAHTRSILTNMDLTIPVINGRAGLGIWQGIFLYEHRTHAQRRNIVVTVQ